MKKIACILFLLTASALSARAEAPNLLTYQGRLKESGLAVTGNRTVEIFFCAAESGGPACETTGAQPVAVVNGLFRSTFTAPALADLATGSWWLEIKVGAATLTPRERLTSGAYALFATSAAFASLADGSVTDAKIAGMAASKLTGALPAISGALLTDLPAAGGGVAKIGDTMTGQLTIAGSSLTVTGNVAASTGVFSGDITAANYQIRGSTVMSTAGTNNLFVGYKSGDSNGAGADNTYLGATAGINNSGSNNAVLGSQAGTGHAGESFGDSVLLGYKAGFDLGNVSNNVLIGYVAGANLRNGGGNIIIGSGQNASGPASGSNSASELNIGGVLFGDLAEKTIGISTRVPQAALDIVSTGTLSNQYAQIWRDSDGDIISSMSATGVLTATAFVGNGAGLTGISGDNLGNHAATQVLAMGAFGVNTSSDVTAARYQINGSTVVALLPGTASLAYGVNAGTSNTTTGNYNTFIGNLAGASNSTADDNTATGYRALNRNTTNGSHTAIGYMALFSNTGGSANTAVGSQALQKNTDGYANSVNGKDALYFNTTGTDNTASGFAVGLFNETGSDNAVFGSRAGGFGGATGNSFSSSTIVGSRAGYLLGTGSDNTLIGFQAGDSLTSGSRNIIIGYDQDVTAAASSDVLNIGGLIFGDLAAKTIGISTRVPQAALDIVSTGTLSNQYAQIWRDSDGTIISSVSATGVLKAAKFVGDGSGITNISVSGDSLGTHVATLDLNMNGRNIDAAGQLTVSTITGPGSAYIYINQNTAIPGSSLAIGRGASLSSFPLAVYGDAAGTIAQVLQLENKAAVAGSGVRLYFSGNGAGWGSIDVVDEQAIGSTSMRFGTFNGDLLWLYGARAGIGTGTPDQKLTVAGNISQTGVIISSGTGNNYFAGRVGVSTAAPTVGLHVYGADSTAATIKVEGAANSYLTLAAGAGSYGGLDYYEGGALKSAIGWQGADDTLRVFAGGGDNLVIDAAGRTGLGLVAPDQKLTVAGNISQTGVLISSGTGDNYFAGKVGIADPTPSYALDVTGSVNATASICIADNCKSSWANIDNLGNHTATQDLVLGVNNITMTGSLGATAARLTKGWFTDLEATNAIAGSITGNAATVTNGAYTNAGNTFSVKQTINASGAAVYSLETSSGIKVNSGLVNLAGTNGLILGAPAAQSIAAGDTIAPDGVFKRVSPTGLVATSAVTAIGDGVTGQMMIIYNAAAFSLSIKNAANTKLPGATDLAFGSGDVLTVVFDGTDWVAVSYVNN